MKKQHEFGTQAVQKVSLVNVSGLVLGNDSVVFTHYLIGFDEGGNICCSCLHRSTVHSILIVMKNRTSRQAARFDGEIRKELLELELSEGQNIDVCIRPLREIQDAESERRRIYGYGPEAAKIRTTTPLYFARTAGNIAVYYATAHMLEYRSHRFIFSEEDTSYHREPFDTDSQCIPSRPIDLPTLQAISEHEGAMKELGWLHAIGISYDTDPVTARVPMHSCPLKP